LVSHNTENKRDNKVIKQQAMSARKLIFIGKNKRFGREMMSKSNVNISFRQKVQTKTVSKSINH